MKTHSVLPRDNGVSFILGRVILFCILIPYEAAQTAPSVGEMVRDHHNREIEHIANHLSGEARADEYFSYVLLPLLGLLGVMFCLRRAFLR